MIDREEIRDNYPPEGYEFSKEELQYLRPIAETLCLIFREPYFEPDPDLPPYWMNYLDEAYAVFNMNGGIDGPAGQAHFVRVSWPVIHPHMIWSIKNAASHLLATIVVFGSLLALVHIWISL